MRRLKILKIYFIFWLFLIFLIYANFEKVYTFFMATLTFNLAVVTVLVIGIIIVLSSALRLTMLTGTFAILRYKKGKELEFYLQGIDKVLPENIANTFRKRATKDVLYFTKQEIEEVSVWLEDKFSHQKIYINFFIGTALMIGLFGTFTGLLQSIDEMGAIILSLTGDINLSEVIASFAGPLGGMAIGFGSSLFGVAAAIILSVKGYILDRNQEIFTEDVMDWMNGQMIESQASPQAQGGGGAGQPMFATATSDSKISGGVMDLFVDKISEFSAQMEQMNKANESMFGMLTDSIDNSAESTKSEMYVLESISTALKEMNINQFSNAGIMEESLQEISGAIINENKTLKQMLELQQKNSELLSTMIQNLDARLEKLEKNR
jgi:hypothetical protein